MKDALHDFLHWWEDAPLYKSIWFIPFVAVLYAIAVLKNILIGENKSE